MSQRDVRPTNIHETVGDHQRRIQILEAVVPPTGSYLQWKGALYRGRQFQVLTANNNYPGGNGASWFDGSWQWIDDPTCPFEGVALESSVEDDWFPFALGNLGPQGTGYAVSFWYYGDPDGARIDLEFATASVDEITGTSGAFGSTTSVLGPSDFEFFGATPPGWYNNGNLNPDHGYRFDLSDGAAGWAIGNVIVDASTFTLESADGTPLTANAVGFDPTWDESSEFLAGGGPDLWWWLRIRNAGPGETAGGFLTRLGQIWVHRLNGPVDFVGG
jgi:hypothetical protein